MSCLSFSVRAGAVRPPPRRLMPLWSDSGPPISTVQCVGRLGVDAHDHTSVVEQQLVAYTTILDQIGVVDAYHFLRAFSERVCSREGELVTDLQLDSLVGKFGDTNFRTLKVTQQCDETPVFGGDIADQLGASLVLVRRAVGKVQTGDVQTRQDQLLEDLWRIAGRAKGSDDFGATNGHAKTPELKRSERLLLSCDVVIVPLHYLDVRQLGNPGKSGIEEIRQRVDILQSTGDSHANHDGFSIAGCRRRLHPLVDE